MSFVVYAVFCWGFPGGSDGKESACNTGSIPRLGRSPGGGNGCPLQYSCLKNSMDRGAWRATVHGVTESLYLGQKSSPPISYTQHVAPGQAAACSGGRRSGPSTEPTRPCSTQACFQVSERAGRQVHPPVGALHCTQPLTCQCPIKPQGTRSARFLCRL